MSNPNRINSHQSTLLEVDYALGYETYKQLSICVLYTSLTLLLNVVSLEPFWYPLETDQFRTQLFAFDHLRRSCSAVCICYSSLPDSDPLPLFYHYNLVLFR